MPTIISKSGKIYNLKIDDKDKRDKKFNQLLKVSAPVKLPDSVNLIPDCSPIADQGSLGCCSGFGIAKGFRECLLIKSGSYIPLSPMFEYYNERAMEGNINDDSGASIRDGMMALNKIGVCPESDYPYEVTKFTLTPSQQAYNDASKYKINSYYRVNDLNGIKQALAQGLPVVIGIDVYESFESDVAAKTGVVPMPKWGEQNLGAHCICLVGYQDTNNGILGFIKQGYVTFRNSWSSAWGQVGYGTMTYDILNKLLNDAWTGK